MIPFTGSLALITLGTIECYYKHKKYWLIIIGVTNSILVTNPMHSIWDIMRKVSTGPSHFVNYLLLIDSSFHNGFDPPVMHKGHSVGLIDNMEVKN